MASPRIELDEVSLEFRLSHEVSLSIPQWMREVYRRRRTGWKPEVHAALRSVSFVVEEGEVVGIIGGNGAGKTTLLRVVGGIYSPDSGRIDVEGSVTAVLGIGVGFNLALSGASNVRLGGLLMGYSLEWIHERMGAIKNFSGLDDFFERPMRYYSSGMIARLGFALAVFTEPEILLIDESLSVGDLGFRSQAVAAMDRIRAKAKVQMIVSHDLDFVGRHCNRAIVMQSGTIQFDGAAGEAIKQYKATLP